MDEAALPELLCAYFAAKGFSITPEAWRDTGGTKSASLWLSGGITVVSEYIDGGRVVEVPFEVRLRIPGENVKDRLEAVEYFRTLAAAAKSKTPDEGGEFTLRVTSGAVKSAIYESGEEEYRAAFAVRYRER